MLDPLSHQGMGESVRAQILPVNPSAIEANPKLTDLRVCPVAPWSIPRILVILTRQDFPNPLFSPDKSSQGVSVRCQCPSGAGISQAPKIPDFPLKCWHSGRCGRLPWGGGRFFSHSDLLKLRRSSPIPKRAGFTQVPAAFCREGTSSQTQPLPTTTTPSTLEGPGETDPAGTEQLELHPGPNRRHQE